MENQYTEDYSMIVESYKKEYGLKIKNLNMHDPSKLRDLTVRMQTLLSDMLPYREEIFQWYEDMIDYKEGAEKYDVNDKATKYLSKYQKRYAETKAEYEELIQEIHKMYSEYSLLNSERRLLLTKNLVKQINLFN